MARKKTANTQNFSFLAGFVQDRGIWRFVAQADMLTEMNEPNSTIFKWVVAEKKAYVYHLDWYATHMAVVTKPHLQVFCIGPEGKVSLAVVEGFSEEEIDPSPGGPRVNGELRALRLIGDRLYAAGMGRQVYRRDKKGRWTHVDKGVIQKPSTEEVAGFNSIDGADENNIYAVGFGGEIWKFNGKSWRRLDSPTNVILNKVRAVRKNLAFACGQNGTLLRSSGRQWKVIEHGATDDQLWDLEWFKGALYLATEEELFRLVDDESLEPIDVNPGADFASGSLHANDGILLSVGRKHIYWTKDGINWQKLDL